MIRTVDVKLNAAHPTLPLMPVETWIGSPVSLRIRGVPETIGRWRVETVSVVAAYPGGKNASVAAVDERGIFVATVEAPELPGSSMRGLMIVADGTDERGNPVTGYVLGVADILVLDRDGTITVGETTYNVHLVQVTPEHPHAGDLALDTLKLYDGEKWISLGARSGVAWNEITDKPTVFPPEAHTHAVADVTGLETALTKAVSDAAEAKAAVVNKRDATDNKCHATTTVDVWTFTGGIHVGPTYTVQIKSEGAGVLRKWYAWLYVNNFYLAKTEIANADVTSVDWDNGEGGVIHGERKVTTYAKQDEYFLTKTYTDGLLDGIDEKLKKIDEKFDKAGGTITGEVSLELGETAGIEMRGDDEKLSASLVIKAEPASAGHAALKVIGSDGGASIEVVGTEFEPASIKKDGSEVVSEKDLPGLIGGKRDKTDNICEAEGFGEFQVSGSLPEGFATFGKARYNDEVKRWEWAYTFQGHMSTAESRAAKDAKTATFDSPDDVTFDAVRPVVATPGESFVTPSGVEKTYVITDAVDGGVSVKINGETVTAFADLLAKCKTGRSVLYGQATTVETGYAFYTAASVTDSVIQFQVSGMLYDKSNIRYGMYVRRIKIVPRANGGLLVDDSGLEGPFAEKSDIPTDAEITGIAEDAVAAKLSYALNADGTVKDRAINTVANGTITIPDGFTDLLVRFTGTIAQINLPSGVTAVGDADLSGEGDWLITVTKTKASEAYIRGINLTEG